MVVCDGGEGVGFLVMGVCCNRYSFFPLWFLGIECLGMMLVVAERSGCGVVGVGFGRIGCNRICCGSESAVTKDEDR